MHPSAPASPRPSTPGRFVRARVVALTAVTLLTIAATAGVASPAGAARKKPRIATAPFTAPSGVALADTPPPWAIPTDATPYIAGAGLTVLDAEQLAVHYHAHLDVIVDGEKVTVPAGVGFVVEHGKATGITVVHTHDPSGIIHVESATDEPYTLGQFFTEWGVALDRNQLGGLRVDGTHVLRASVNGHRFDGDPATIRLRPHLEIALWYGPAHEPAQVPKSYHFPAGL